MNDYETKEFQSLLLEKMKNTQYGYTTISREDKLARLIDLIIYWIELEQKK